jgi:hypothetical protein
MWLLVKVANEIMTCGMKESYRMTTEEKIANLSSCFGLSLTKHKKKKKIRFCIYGNSIFNSKVDKMFLLFLVSKRYSFFNHEAECN